MAPGSEGTEAGLQETSPGPPCNSSSDSPPESGERGVVTGLIAGSTSASAVGPASSLSPKTY